jgi:hypothetical protein
MQCNNHFAEPKIHHRRGRATRSSYRFGKPPTDVGIDDDDREMIAG